MLNDLVIVWRITEKCNLDCKFCGYAHTLNRSRAEVEVEQVIRFGTLLADYCRLTRRGILVSWLGGEPFTWKPLFDVSHIYKYDFGLRVSVTTNGMALKSEKTREQILHHFDEITVSLDGFGAQHDWTRNKKGLFEDVRAGIISLSNLKERMRSPLLIRVNTILMHNNIYDFESLCSELASWGVVEISFNSLGDGERPEFFPANHLLARDVEWFAAELPRIRATMQRHGLRILGSSIYLKRIALLARNVPVPIHDCLPGRQYLFIDEKGMIAPCNVTVNGYGVSVNQLNTVDGLKSLPEIFSMLKQKQMLAPCSDCQSTHVFEKFSKQFTDVNVMES